MKERKCEDCKIIKSYQEFYFREKVNAKRETYIYCPPYCKVCNIKRNTEYINNNRERHNALNQKWINNNRKKHLAQRRSHDRSEYQRNWQKKNKDKIKSYNLERSQNKTHEITMKEWTSCKEYFSYECAYCGMTEGEHKKLYNQQLHKEHVIHEGRNDIKNCVPSCRQCNASKRTYSLNHWYNDKNDNYSRERYLKIYKWLRYDVHNYIEKKA